jgi:hypothetical protein
MSLGGRNRVENRLWPARKRRVLEQKQVAYLLNHHTSDQVSRYELGTRLPTLETALLLEMIYGAPLRVLYRDLYERLQAELRDRLKRVPQLQERLAEFFEEETVRGYCAYGEILQTNHPTQTAQLNARRHVTELAKRLAYL